MKNDYQNDLKELTHSSFNNHFAISISSFDGADSFGHCVLGGGASFVQIPTMRDAMELDKYIITSIRSKRSYQFPKFYRLYRI